MKQFISKNIFSLYWITLLAIASGVFYFVQYAPNFKRQLASSDEYKNAEILVDGELISLESYFDDQLHSSNGSLDSLIRGFLIKISQNDSEAWTGARERYTKLGEKLKSLQYSLGTSSVQYESYSAEDKKTLAKAVEAYFIAYYVLAWHHAYLFHLGAPMSNLAGTNSCIDAGKIKTWEAISNCKLILEKEVAMILNEKVSADLASVPILSSLQWRHPIIKYIQKNIVEQNRYIGLASLDLTQEIRVFLEFNVLKKWEDPYYYAKFLKFNGLREAMANYWSISRYQKAPENLLKTSTSNVGEYLLTATYENSTEWIISNQYLRELFSKDFYFNALNNYQLLPTKNNDVVGVYSNMWSNLIDKSKKNNMSNLLWSDGRFCKASLGCKLIDGKTDLYDLVMKSLIGTPESCETSITSGKNTFKWNCISKIHNFLYAKNEFSHLVALANTRFIDEQLFTEDNKKQTQKAVTDFIQSNPGLVNNALLGGEDLTLDLMKLKNLYGPYGDMELGKKIISPIVQAKTIAIAGSIYNFLLLDEIEWNSVTNPGEVVKLSEDDKSTIYKNVYCRTASILWGLDPKEIQSELIECAPEQQASNYVERFASTVNQFIKDNFSHAKQAESNLVEKVSELNYYNSMVNGSKVADYLAGANASTHEFRPFDSTTLEVYAKLRVGAVEKQNNYNVFERSIFNFLTESKYLEFVLDSFGDSYNEVCARVYPIKDENGKTVCNHLSIKSVEEKATFLRRAVYESIYSKFAELLFAGSNPKMFNAISQVRNGQPFSDEFKKLLQNKIHQYTDWSWENAHNHNCPKTKNSSNELDLLMLTQPVYGRVLLGEKSLNRVSLTHLGAASATSQSLWSANFQKVYYLSGAKNYKAEGVCPPPDDFFENSFDLVLLGKVFGLFSYSTLFELRKKIDSQSEEGSMSKPKNNLESIDFHQFEPKNKKFNDYYARYVYGLLSNRFPFLKVDRPQGNHIPVGKGLWFGTGFLDLAKLRSADDMGEVHSAKWNSENGLSIVKSLLNQSWVNFKIGYNTDLLNYYNNINLNDKNELSNFKQDKKFKNLFDHFEDFRFSFTAYHLIQDKVLASFNNATKYLNSESTLKKWFQETADKKITDTYYPVGAFWEKLKPFALYVMIAGAVLSLGGILIAGSIQALSAGMVLTIISLDIAAVSLMLGNSAYNIVYKNSIDLPSAITAQTKVATAFSFYSQSSLPTKSTWGVKLSEAAETTEDKMETSLLKNQSFNLGQHSQDLAQVRASENKLRKKMNSDVAWLVVDALLFYLPVAPQITRNILILKNRRTLKQVMEQIGLPYMNLPQRINYWFKKSPEVDAILDSVKNSPAKKFFKKALLAVDPRSQMYIVKKSGFKYVEEAFFIRLMNQNPKAKALIQKSLGDKLAKSINPQIDVLHAELELYINFMRDFAKSLDKLTPAKWDELLVILNQKNNAKHFSNLEAHIKSWMDKGIDLEKALVDESLFVQEVFGKLPMEMGDDIKRIFDDIVMANKIHQFPEGDLLIHKLSSKARPELEQALNTAYKHNLEMINVLNVYDKILDISKYHWNEASSKFMQTYLKKTPKLEGDILGALKAKRMPKINAPEEKLMDEFYASMKAANKTQIEDDLAKAWTDEIFHSPVDGVPLGLSMMLRDFNGMYSKLKGSPELTNFIRSNMKDADGVANFFKYLDSGIDSPVYTKLIDEWVQSSGVLGSVDKHLSKLKGGAAYYHYYQVVHPTALPMPGLPSPK